MILVISIWSRVTIIVKVQVIILTTHHWRGRASMLIINSGIINKCTRANKMKSQTFEIKKKSVPSYVDLKTGSKKYYNWELYVQERNVFSTVVT